MIQKYCYLKKLSYRLHDLETAFTIDKSNYLAKIKKKTDFYNWKHTCLLILLSSEYFRVVQLNQPIILFRDTYWLIENKC